jgi:hypothetical protein
MTWQDVAFAAAGAIGGGTAVVHGVLVQRLMIRPLAASLADTSTPGSIRRLVPLLLHFSTVVWFLGGLVLIAAAVRLDGGARLAAGLFVGATFLFGAVVNFWATRGRHPGWMLMAAAVVLVALGLDG